MPFRYVLNTFAKTRFTVIQGDLHDALSSYPNANCVSLFFCRPWIKVSKRQKHQVQHSKYATQFQPQTTAKSAYSLKTSRTFTVSCLRCIWRVKDARPSARVFVMESWVRFSAQSQAKERVFRCTNTHSLRVLNTTTTSTLVRVLDSIRFAACLDT